MSIYEKDLATRRAYLAGLIDGEGCMTVLRRYRRKRDKDYVLYSPTVVMGNTNRDAARFCLSMYPGGFIARNQPSNPNAKVSWIYRSGPVAAREMARDLEPYLLLKREQAELIVPFPRIYERGSTNESRERDRRDQKYIYDRLRVLNQRGSIR